MISVTIPKVESSGEQRFAAESERDLIDQLAKAQYHATKKIREQAHEIKRLKASVQLLRARRQQIKRNEETANPRADQST